ncbi:hypothetical protein GCM10027290_18230 [Micromonospora sonneratiae]
MFPPGAGPPGTLRGMASKDDGDEWLIRLPERLEHLRDIGAREDELDLDFSLRSLPDLERYLTDRFEEPEVMDQDEDAEWIIEGAAAYVGEMLLRLAGGHWEPTDDPRPWHVPPIHADQALALPSLAPLDLVLTAVRDRTGDVFERQYADWTATVQAYRTAHPSWSPTKQPTPLVDPVPVVESEREYLARWLATREQSFPNWVARYGQGTTWDFSVASLAVLGALVLRVTPTLEAFHAPEQAEFVEGAAWYTGESLRRARNGHWTYRHGDPEVNPYGGQPYVRQQKDGGAAGLPHLALKTLVKRHDPQLLVDQYEAFMA